MIAAWMLWSAGIGLLFLAAGLAAERLLTLGGRPTRWVWIVAGVATAALSALRMPGGAPDQTAPPPGYVPALLEPLAVTVSSDSMLRSFDDVLVLGWVALSALLVVTVLFAFARLVREGKSWRPGSLGNRSVLWSRDTGPTTVGLLRPRVVLPAWVRAIGASEQELILAHEEEHIRAGDPRLRLLMTLPLFVFPWNPALWLQRHRLGLAVELDCDRRVMRRMPGHRHIYGNLLLRVGAGRSGLHRLALVSLSEGRSQLDRRIRGLVEKVPRARRIQGLLLLLGVAAVVALAILFPRIRGEGAPAEDQLAELMEAPTFTPFTVRPDLVNAEEVQEALEDEYRPRLRETGIGGTANVQFFIDAEGEVQRVMVAQTSGHEALDSAALRVARVFRFTPALNLDERVPVWIAIPITFGTGNEAAGSSQAEAAREFFEAVRRLGDQLGADTTASPADSSAFLEAVSRLREEMQRADEQVPAGDSSSPTEASLADAPTFTPFTVRPDLVNEAEAMQAMDEEYPPMLREAGIGGTVNVHFFINVEGEVQRVMVAQTSGHEALDSAALRVARVFRFTPALNLDERVPVWIAIPLTFQPDEAGDEEQAEADTQAGVAERLVDEVERLRSGRLPPVSSGFPADPGTRQEASVADTPTVTPFTVPPDLLNEEEVQQAMESEYPPILRDAGIEGTVHVHIFINVDGDVENALLAQSSGHEPLDDAGLRVARVMRFTPARDQAEIVPVWIAIPLTFTPDGESP